MEFLGSGWQFDVYAEGDKVIKRPTSSWSIARRVLQNYPGLILRPSRLVAKVRRLQRETGETLQQLSLHKVPGHLLADLSIEDDHLVQNRVTPLGEVLRDDDAGRRIISSYIDSIIEGWKHGIAETSFNFTVNHGIDETGRVMIIDVGEMTFDRRVVAGMISHYFWERAFSTSTLASGLRRFYLSQMADRITATALQEIWRDAPPVRERTDDRPPRHVLRRRPVHTRKRVSGK